MLKYMKKFLTTLWAILLLTGAAAEDLDSLYRSCLTDPKTAGDKLYELAEQKYADEQFTASAWLGEKALPLLRKNNPDLVSDCLSVLSIAHHRTGDFDKALEYQRECYEIDLASGDQANISSSLNNLAAIYLATEDYETAAEMIHKAIEIEREQEGTQALCIRLGMASDIDLRLGRFDEALQHAREAYELDRAAGRDERAAIRLSQLAAVYTDTGDAAHAASCLWEAIPVFEKSQNHHSLSVCYNQLGGLALGMGNKIEAESHFRRAIELAGNTGNRYIERKAQRGLAEAIIDARPREAYAHLNRFVELTDSMYANDNSRQINEFKVKYDLAEKEHQIELESQKVRTRNTLLILFGIITALLIFGIVLLVRSERIQKKNARMLEKANELKDRLLALNKAGNAHSGEAIKEIAEEISAIGAESQVHLTAREIEVVKYCCEGLMSKEIADRMNISQRTVDSHKTNIFRKLGINTTVELVGYAHRAGLL